MSARKVAIVGSGIFGVTAAVELAHRGDHVVLYDLGPVPHPLAASTDISKVVRLDYGADETYTAFMERALDGWRRYNEEYAEPLFHETGVVFLCRGAMDPGGFEHDSYALLRRRGHRVVRVDSAEIRRRFPAWDAERFVDGYFNPQGGWAASGRVVAKLADVAVSLGVERIDGAARLVERGSRVSGVEHDGVIRDADRVVVAAGSWTPHLLPFMAAHLRSVSQPVFHLAPDDASAFRAERFPVFGADIAKTGYYGFPATPDGIVKIANHGPGVAMHPESPARGVTREDESRLRAFLAETFPSLARAPLAATRACLYCDTHDEHFWIAPDPERAGLVVATGGSGHAFKFAPLLGGLIADAVDGNSHRKFRWRPDVRPARGEEAARRHD